MATINEKTFLAELLQAFPEFKDLHESNKEYHDIGIHLIFGDFRRFAEDAIARDEKNHRLLPEWMVLCHWDIPCQTGLRPPTLPVQSHC